MALADDIFGDLLSLIGADALLRLAEDFGGTRVYVARSPTPASPLAASVGEPAARLLSGRFGGDYLKVPLARTWRVQIYRQRGDSHSAIARRLGVTEGAVNRILAEVGLTNPRQRSRDGGCASPQCVGRRPRRGRSGGSPNSRKDFDR